jgi:glycosyltransferase involved in cell wall biosynthesis
MHVAFINENTLGHASYLRPFARELERRTDLGIVPHWIDATPLPPDIARSADRTVPILRRWGLDFHAFRWRMAASRHAASQLAQLQTKHPVATALINTQSVALEVFKSARSPALFVSLDATFAQLARSGWFSPNRASRWFHPITLSTLRYRERMLYSAARRLLPWSELAATSLRAEYPESKGKISVLPASVPLEPMGVETHGGGKPQRILFIGGDLHRKGGDLLIECFRTHLRGQCELDLVTRTPVHSEPGIHVHAGIEPHSPEWRRLWREAGVFIFPSKLETFGIVLVEALAFGVPVISSDAGAAREILDDGNAGIVLAKMTSDSLAAAIREVFAQNDAARMRAEFGRRRALSVFNLEHNTERLAEWLRTVEGSRV